MRHFPNLINYKQQLSPIDPIMKEKWTIGFQQKSHANFHDGGIIEKTSQNR